LLLILQKADSAFIKEIPEAASAIINGFLLVPGKFMKQPVKIVNPRGIWKPVSTGTCGFLKLFQIAPAAF
jgi:hypothetical protein